MNCYYLLMMTYWNMITNIKISERNKHRLKMLALTPSESYENIILRLLTVRLGNRNICYNISQDNVNINCSVNWGSDEINIQWLNDKGKWVTTFPTTFKDVDDEVWLDFRNNVLTRKSLVSNLSVLDYDEEIVFGNLLLKRID